MCNVFIFRYIYILFYVIILYFTSINKPPIFIDFRGDGERTKKNNY